MWKQPLDHGGMNIASYIITVLSEDKQLLHTEDVVASKVEHKIAYDFKPKTSYELKIKARSEAGLGVEEILVVETDEFCEYLFLYSW